GFHLANRELDRLGRREQKGAPETFDADGYAALLHRLRSADSIVYAPVFDREIDESIGSATAVEPRTPLIVTEGNYLLLPNGSWPQVRAAIDTVWYLEVPEATRTQRLMKRHSRFGRSSEAAADWVRRVDQPNADMIAAARSRADLIVEIRT
ncbi:MAG: nucleoside/nucleotide kinase family protein, partial [Rhodococcus sp. (in: high G+C Gram-positive bacteria)]